MSKNYEIVKKPIMIISDRNVKLMITKKTLRYKITILNTQIVLGKI